MKTASWILLVLGAIALLGSVGGKLLPSQHLFGHLPSAWWRLAMALVVFAMALKIVGGDGRPTA